MPDETQSPGGEPRSWKIEKFEGDELFEVIKGGAGQETRVTFRKPGVASADSYAPLPGPGETEGS